MALRNLFRNGIQTSRAFMRRRESLLASTRQVGTSEPELDKKEIKIIFVKPNGDKITAKGKVGESLLDVVLNNNVDIDGFGACEGTLTCSTCHLIFKKQDFDQIEDKQTDEELDMLDLAYDLCDTSRLGCQIQVTDKLDGVEIKVPSSVNDVRNN